MSDFLNVDALTHTSINKPTRFIIYHTEGIGGGLEQNAKNPETLPLFSKSLTDCEFGTSSEKKKKRERAHVRENVNVTQTWKEEEERWKEATFPSGFRP